jgi:hypothetical protein
LAGEEPSGPSRLQWTQRVELVRKGHRGGSQ